MTLVILFAGELDFVMTKTGVDGGFVLVTLDGGCGDGSAFSDCAGFSPIQMAIKTKMPMTMKVAKNLLPGFLVLDGGNVLSIGTAKV